MRNVTSLVFSPEFVVRYKEIFSDSEIVLLFLDGAKSVDLHDSPGSPFEFPSIPQLEALGWSLSHRLEEPRLKGECAFVLRRHNFQATFTPVTAVWLNAIGVFNHIAGWRQDGRVEDGLPGLCYDKAIGQYWTYSALSEHEWAICQRVNTPTFPSSLKRDYACEFAASASVTNVTHRISIDATELKVLGLSSFKLKRSTSETTDFTIHTLDSCKAIDISRLIHTNDDQGFWFPIAQDRQSTKEWTEDEPRHHITCLTYDETRYVLQSRRTLPVEEVQYSPIRSQFVNSSRNLTWPHVISISPTPSSENQKSFEPGISLPDSRSAWGTGLGGRPSFDDPSPTFSLPTVPRDWDWRASTKEPEQICAAGERGQPTSDILNFAIRSKGPTPPDTEVANPSRDVTVNDPLAAAKPLSRKQKREEYDIRRRAGKKEKRLETQSRKKQERLGSEEQVGNNIHSAGAPAALWESSSAQQPFM